MQKLGFIICNAGDGSNHLEWFYPLTDAQLEIIEEHDPECYSSGDGIQYTELTFPDEFSLEGWCGINHIIPLPYEQWFQLNKVF